MIKEDSRPIPSCCEPHHESEAEFKTFHMKISFVCIGMKTKIHNLKTLHLASLSK